MTIYTVFIQPPVHTTKRAVRRNALLSWSKRRKGHPTSTMSTPKPDITRPQAPSWSTSFQNLLTTLFRIASPVNQSRRGKKTSHTGPRRRCLQYQLMGQQCSISSPNQPSLRNCHTLPPSLRNVTLLLPPSLFIKLLLSSASTPLSSPSASPLDP